MKNDFAQTKAELADLQTHESALRNDIESGDIAAGGLRADNNRLRGEVAEHAEDLERAEQHLRKTKQQLNELVAERETDAAQLLVLMM